MIRPNYNRAVALLDAARLSNRAHVLIRVVGDVTDAMAARVCRQLAAAPKANTVSLFVNSPGGDLRAARRIYDAIRKHPARRKLAHGYGAVASAAALIYTAADVRRLWPGSRVLLHAVSMEPATSSRWTRATYESHAATLAALDESVAQSIAERCGVPVSMILARMADERPTPLIEALSIGFAHEIVGESPPLQKAWPAAARAALLRAQRFTHGANARLYSPGFIAACEIGGR